MAFACAPEVFNIPGIGGEDAHAVAVAGEAFANLLKILLGATDIRIVALDDVQEVHAILGFRFWILDWQGGDIIPVAMGKWQKQYQASMWQLCAMI